MLAILRLLKTFVRAARLPTLHPHETCITHWRVLPGDIDAFGHMNNARYPVLMDIARVDFLLRCGLFRGVVRRRWAVPVGSLHLRFRRSLKPFERFELHTRLLHWDERWFYFRHDFYRLADRSQPVCTAHVSTLFLGRQGAVGTDVVVPALAGRPLAPPSGAEEVRHVFGPAARQRETNPHTVMENPAVHAPP